MSKTVLLAAVLGVIGTSYPCLAADPGDSDQQEMQMEIKDMKTRLADLEAREQRLADANATKAEVMTDAEQRSSITGGNFSTGYSGGKLLLQSADKNFLLHPWFQLQFRNITNFRQDSKANGNDQVENGFEVRRMKFGFDGNVFTPDFTYLFVWATDRHTGDPTLEESWARYKFTDSPWAIKAGQFKDPLDHEQLVSSKYLMSVERSLTTDVFANGDAFVQGVTLGYDPKQSFRAEGGFTDGLKSGNTNFQDYPDVTSGNPPPADWGAAGRMEYKVFGNWKDYDHFTAIGNTDDLLVFGAGADYTEAGDTDSLVHVVDAQYATMNHWSLYGAYLGRFTKNNQAGPTSADTYDWTLRGQVAYAIDQHWEPFVRYDFIDFDSDGIAAGSETHVHDATVGVNYYFQGQAAKFTLDASYLPNGTPVADDGGGILSSDGKRETLIRAQFQLLL